MADQRPKTVDGWLKAGKHKAKDTETVFFEPRDQPGIQTRIWMKVLFNRLEDVQGYFRWNFLSPKDHVERWRITENKKDADSKYTAQVTVLLGQEKVPPKQRSPAQFYEHMRVEEDQLRLWSGWKDGVEVAIANLDPSSPKYESSKEEMLIFLEKLEGPLDEVCTEWMHMTKYQPGAKVHQKFKMRCEVERAPVFCHLCYTVAHPFSTCEARGCTVCGSKKHPHYKCSKKCECKTSPPHVKAECPRKAMKAGSEPKSGSLRTIQRAQMEQNASSLRNLSADHVAQSAAHRDGNPASESVSDSVSDSVSGSSSNSVSNRDVDSVTESFTNLNTCSDTGSDEISKRHSKPGAQWTQECR